jgi:hypothetical protein
VARDESGGGGDGSVRMNGTVLAEGERCLLSFLIAGPDASPAPSDRPARAPRPRSDGRGRFKIGRWVCAALSEGTGIFAPVRCARLDSLLLKYNVPSARGFGP